MGITPLHIGMIALGAVIYAVWLFLYLKGKQFEEFLNRLRKKIFR